MAEVKVVKLMTGQEIIAKVVSESSSELVVDSPLMLQAMRPNSPNDTAISLGLIPFSWAGLPHNVALNKQHILCVLAPEPQLQTQYLAGLAGIAVPDAATTSLPKLKLVE